MKKIFKLTIILCLAFCMTTGYAQTYTKNNLGISFYLSDNWKPINETEDTLLFNHAWSSNEGIRVAVTPFDGAYDVDLFDEDTWKELCEDWYSNERLAESLNEANNIYNIHITSDSEQSRYETFGETKYYRYEKAYTARAYGFYDQGFYDTLFLTAKNGKLYEIEYTRDDDLNENHFADVVSMLESISYALGETKIVIDGERVITDSAPMIISGRTLVPIRAVAEKMGYKVGWNDATQTATLIGKYDLAFTINSQTAVKNSKEFSLDVPAILFHERTYLPLRAVTEAMDAQVRWSEEENTVYITSPKY